MDDLLGELTKVDLIWTGQEDETIKLLDSLCQSLKSSGGTSIKAFCTNIAVEAPIYLKAALAKQDLVRTTADDSAHEEAINQCLLQHFYREGNFEAGDALSQEIHSMTDVKLKEPFEEMHSLTRSLAQHEIGPVVEWARKNEEALGITGLCLQFKLYTLGFISLLRSGSANDDQKEQESRSMAALKYAKQWIKPFSDIFPQDVESLIGALAFAHQLDQSPYNGILYDDMWGEAEDSLVVAYCTVLGLPRESSLRLCLNIGTYVWPKISRVLGIMKDRPGVDWNPQEELPVEVDTGPASRFHSVFVCPVLRQQSTITNPPMMMPCGHVLCLEALNRLSKGNQNYRIKCPYCPAESTASMAQKITF